MLDFSLYYGKEDQSVAGKVNEMAISNVNDLLQKISKATETEPIGDFFTRYAHVFTKFVTVCNYSST